MSKKRPFEDDDYEYDQEDDDYESSYSRQEQRKLAAKGKNGKEPDASESYISASYVSESEQYSRGGSDASY